MTFVRCLKTQFWDEKKIYCCRKKTSRSYDVLRRSSEMKRKFIVVEKNIAIVRCLEMQFWDEKKNLLLSKKTMRSYDVLKCSFQIKKRIYCCRKKHHDRTMSWNAVLKWKEKFIVVEKNNAIVRCLEMQFWNEKKNLLLSKKTMRSYDVLKCNFEMKRKIYCCQKKTSRLYDVLRRISEMKKKIYCCRKKQCDRTMSWNAVLKWKKEFIVVEKNNAIVRCLEMQFSNEKKIYCCWKKTSRSYKILKRNFEMNNNHWY
jgi:uncharacterized pyridoxamine 5'-phosphate oxidase family protein